MLVAWWTNYGSETPHLQMMALKIVSLTSSSSGCERNWSAFEGVTSQLYFTYALTLLLNNIAYFYFAKILLSISCRSIQKKGID